MKKIKTGNNSGGFAQPEIRIGDRGKDAHGALITVESVDHNRVTFYREGYLSPCIQPDSRFIKEFKPVREIKP